jgi:surfeit locus 1 family protein
VIDSDAPSRIPTRRRIIAGHIAVAFVVFSCIGLGIWQLDRLHQKRVRKHEYLARARIPAVPIGQLPPARATQLAYRHASVTGRFDVAREVVLRSRSLNDEPGNHVLTPLVLDAGGAVLVDRGWVPYGLASPPVRAASPPGGLVEVTGILLPAERPFGLGPSEPATGVLRETFYADVSRLQKQMPYRLYPLYLLLRTQSPRQAHGLPVAVDFPAPDEGPHLSYAIQWFSFATIAVVTYAFVLRKRRRRAR